MPAVVINSHLQQLSSSSSTRGLPLPTTITTTPNQDDDDDHPRRPPHPISPTPSPSPSPSSGRLSQVVVVHPHLVPVLLSSLVQQQQHYLQPIAIASSTQHNCTHAYTYMHTQHPLTHPRPI
ncbi:hypothetical protein PAAG_05063 [Paracoccidioides lutzii Pb01]|uniref:Uncharacterized protein n=1 Tax=Paracoccidioides lutzii (strain ATCC MYA-826 / Pb01) TaxID=502779 RepID=C1H2S0_PARBA|nr:hypothetical protein PAAG_05063 [Paracoccidioides lutzii Pb01]EEH34014.2 hypothetical protein PAAG_05063 [Paracoccidioides lutzii Pb01]